MKDAMMTARQALANTTHFRNEGLCWLKKSIAARRTGDVKAETEARRQLARVKLQLITVRRWQAGAPSGVAFRGLGVAG